MCVHIQRRLDFGHISNLIISWEGSSLTWVIQYSMQLLQVLFSSSYCSEQCSSTDRWVSHIWCTSLCIIQIFFFLLKCVLALSKVTCHNLCSNLQPLLSYGPGQTQILHYYFYTLQKKCESVCTWERKCRVWWKEQSRCDAESAVIVQGWWIKIARAEHNVKRSCFNIRPWQTLTRVPVHPTRAEI